jgi:hypothetical protein
MKVMQHIEKIQGMKQVLDVGLGVEEVFTGDQAKINEIVEKMNDLIDWFNGTKDDDNDEEMVGDDVFFDK